MAQIKFNVNLNVEPDSNNQYGCLIYWPELWLVDNCDEALNVFSHSGNMKKVFPSDLSSYNVGCIVPSSGTVSLTDLTINYDDDSFPYVQDTRSCQYLLIVRVLSCCNTPYDCSNYTTYLSDIVNLPLSSTVNEIIDISPNINMSRCRRYKINITNNTTYSKIRIKYRRCGCSGSVDCKEFSAETHCVTNTCSPSVPDDHVIEVENEYNSDFFNISDNIMLDSTSGGYVEVCSYSVPEVYGYIESVMDWVLMTSDVILIQLPYSNQNNTRCCNDCKLYEITNNFASDVNPLVISYQRCDGALVTRSIVSNNSTLPNSFIVCAVDSTIKISNTNLNPGNVININLLSGFCRAILNTDCTAIVNTDPDNPYYMSLAVCGYDCNPLS